MKNDKSEICQSCGKCCLCVVLPVQKSLRKAIMMNWLDARGCDIVKETFDTMYVKIDKPCPHLDQQILKNGSTIYSCNIYKSRPIGCREFDGKNVDFLDCNLKHEKYVILEK